MAERDEEFYTGYLPQAPAGIATWMKAWTAVIFLLVIAVALVLVSGQRPFTTAAYEFGVIRDFEGVVRQSPYPTLEVERPGATSDAASVSRYFLVRPFKFGADVAEHDGRRVRAKGSLLYLDDSTMVELLPDELEPIGAATRDASVAQALGRHTLRGLIVDSKCYFGIMKPGSEKPHRACAARCISGGIPPLFVVRGEGGLERRMLLVGADGRALNQEVLEYVAEPLAIEGEVSKVEGLWILKADPADFRRL